MSPSRVPASGGRAIERRGWYRSPRASEASTSVIASMHDSMSRSPLTSCSETTITAWRVRSRGQASQIVELGPAELEVERLADGLQVLRPRRPDDDGRHLR